MAVWLHRPGVPSLGVGEGATRARRTDALSALVRPTAPRTVEASVLPTPRLLLPKGAFIDCTLEMAIGSTLPGEGLLVDGDRYVQRRWRGRTARAGLAAGGGRQER